MTHTIERVEAHYEAHEVPFSSHYEWHQAYTALEYDCGEKLVLTGTSTKTTCGGCGADHNAFPRDTRKRESRLRDEVTHPWLHDTQDRAEEQHLRDEDYPKYSPWRYNDFTLDNTNYE
jgi:hypothetical protein